MAVAVALEVVVVVTNIVIIVVDRSVFQFSKISRRLCCKPFTF